MVLGYANRSVVVSGLPFSYWLPSQSVAAQSVSGRPVSQFPPISEETLTTFRLASLVYIFLR
jgi:hypothetical protein